MFGAKRWPPEIFLFPTQFWWPEYRNHVFHRTAVQRPQSR
ncbi:hypothetical protein AYI69_g5902, partial [Smittium culicis]